jgi:hypothetical protein
MADKTKTVDGSSKIERALNMAKQMLTLGVNKNEVPYCIINDNAEDNLLAFPLRGAKTNKWLRQLANTYGDLLRNDDIAEVVETLCALAAVSENIMDIHLRTASLDGGGVAIDLGHPSREVIHLKNGTSTLVTTGSKTLFTRSPTMLGLPFPAKQGNIKKLIKYLNMSTEHKWLFIGWLTFTISHPKNVAPYPFLDIKGEMGSGKSFLCKLIIRSLIDNNTCGVQIFPKNERDLAISTQNQLVLIYDNIRSLSKNMSDLLCTVCTGGTYATRQLFSDIGEIVLSLHSPVVLNGIHNAVIEADLNSRGVTINMLRIDNHQRLDESKIAKEFKDDLPHIFKGLLDLSAKLLEIESTVEVTHGERMIAYSRWLAALEVVNNRPQGELQLMYRNNIKASMLCTIQENYLAMALLNFASNLPGSNWQGTPTQLLQSLEEIAPSHIINRRTDWPSNPISMSKRLRILENVLESQGVTLEFSQGKSRQISVLFTQP